MGIARLRIVLIALMGAVVALAASDIFDVRRWELLVPPGVIGVIALATASRGRLVRLAGGLVSVAGGVVAVAYLSGGSLDDARLAVTSGVQRILSTEWPSPSEPDLIATVALVSGALLAIASELARSARLHLSPVVPVAVSYSLVVALSSPLGARPWWLVPLAILAAVFAVLRPGVSLRERWTLLGGERRLVPIIACAFALTATIAFPLALGDRADPRRSDDVPNTQSVLDPIEATLALQSIDPPIPLHTIELTSSTDGVPTRWRTAALAGYDGRRWEPSLRLRPIGRTLDPAGGADLTGTVSFLDDDLQLVPLPGAPVTIDARIETDVDRTLVLLVDRPEPGTSVPFTARAAPDLATTAPGAIGTREVDETVSGLTELAESIIADAAVDGVVPPDILGRLRLLETAMRDDFLLDSGARGGGLQRALIVRFLRDTRRGNAEQFATAFVLLARSLGVDARVATGFDITDESADDGSVADDGLVVTVSSADAAVWPEVRTDDGWLAFDPAPDDEVSDAEPEPDQPQVQTPAAPQPPIAPPPEATDDPATVEDEEQTTDENALPTVVEVGLRVAATIGALLIPIILVVLLVLGLKWRRRRKQLTGPPESMIRGAWTVATNRLVDAGLSITPASTNDEIADDGAEYAPSADRELHRLATLASAATFGSPARPDLLAQDATACLGQVETSMSESRTRWQRLRWHLSLRSLRRNTRSPV